MRRRRLSQRGLRGQLLFAELGADSITLDCILGASAGSAAAVPVTLTARLSGRASGADEPAIALLQRWADEMTPIGLRVHEGAGGPEVELSTTTGRVVLESYYDGDWE